MISEIIKNSASTVKIHAKLKYNLSVKDYERMVSFSTLTQLAAFLKTKENYRQALSEISPETVHRSDLERVLNGILKADIESLLHFSSASAKSFLSLFEIRDQIANLKLLLRRLIRESEEPVILPENAAFNYFKLSKAQSVEAFIECLSGTIYEKPLRAFSGTKEKQSLFRMETALDMFYQDKTNEYINKYLTDDEAKIAMRAYGTEIDLQSIMFIIRAKTFYGFDAKDIYPYVGDRGYRLSKDELKAIIDAPDETAALAAAEKTCYKELFGGGLKGIEGKISAYSLRMHKKGFKLKPYSLESILCYIKIREVEIRNVIMITEGIRYGLPPEEIKSFIISINQEVVQ